jgi:MFS family permease
VSEKVSRDIILRVVFLSLAGEIAWAVENQYYNVFLYEYISPLPIYVSIMVAITTTVGTIATIIMGSLSDVRGRRKPFLLYGYIFWAVTTAIFPLSAFFIPIGVGFAVFTAITFDSIMTFFGATAKNASLNAYITDVTTLKNRGKVTSVAQMMVLVSLLVVYGGAGILINFLTFYGFFYFTGFLVGLFGILGSIRMKEPSNINRLDLSVGKHIKNTFKRSNLSGSKNFFIVLVVIGCWGIALNICFPFLIIYLNHYIGLDVFVSSMLMFIALAISIILAYPIGIIIDKIGRKKITYISVFLFSLSLFLFGLSDNEVTLVITGTMWLVFYTALSVSTFAWVKDLYPSESRGQFSGYWNLFSGTIPMVIGPFIGGWIATEFGIYGEISPGQWGFIPPPLIYFVAAIFALITFIPLIFAKEKEPN